LGTFGEIRLVAFTTVPPDWAVCNGQLLSIAQNQALFSILGTTYGGDGTSNFALPDLRGLVPMHTSSTFALGTVSGAETVALTASQIPIHTHAVTATTDPATAPSPAAAILAAAPATLGDVYAQQTGLTSMASQDVGNAGASQPHSNMQPFLVVNYIICTNGIFPEHP
jgi:microcystin-dependent protein